MVGGIMSIVSFMVFVLSGIPTIIENKVEPVELYRAWLSLGFFILGLIIIGLSWLYDKLFNWY